MALRREVRRCGLEGGHLPVGYPGVFTKSIAGCMVIATHGHPTGRFGGFTCFYVTHILAGQLDNDRLKRIPSKPDQAWAVLAPNYATGNYGVSELRG